MTFSKAFPKRSDKSVYPEWVDVELTEGEEAQVEAAQRVFNNNLMQECLVDAKELLKEQKGYESSVVTLAQSLFEKRASHVAYWKEEKAKEKFDKL